MENTKSHYLRKVDAWQISDIKKPDYRRQILCYKESVGGIFTICYALEGQYEFPEERATTQKEE